MSEYHPDKWVVIKITGPEIKLYKVFACWYGGYAGSDSWKLNSGITRATFRDNCYEFDGHSGSVYTCHKSAYGTNGYGGGVLGGFIEKSAANGHTIEIMPEDTDWTTLDYDPLQQWLQKGQEPQV
jgi:hypothetical protein